MLDIEVLTSPIQETPVKLGQVRSSSQNAGFILAIGDRGMFNGVELTGGYKGETVYGAFVERNTAKLKTEYPYVHDAKLSIFVGGE